eukprot:6712327-Prymnesium_polylepis.1
MDLAAQRQEEQEQRAVAATRVQAVARGKSTRAILLHSGSSFMSDIDGSNMDMDIKTAETLRARMMSRRCEAQGQRGST